VLKKQVSGREEERRALLAGGAPIKGKGNWFAPTVLATSIIRCS
jgi:acyl-CoA reductase-like NAD-dependent aldehyde dehydrogenase